MTSTQSSSTISLNPAPQDSVARVCFSQSAEDILCATWAGTLSVHNTQTGALRTEVKKYSAALLDAAWSSENIIIAAALDGAVLQSTIDNGVAMEWKVVGTHDAGVRSIVCAANNLIVSGGWDGRIKVWAPGKPRPTFDLDAGGKVYGMTTCTENSVAYINSSRQVRLIDIRKPSEAVYEKIPPKVNHQLRGISVSPDQKEYVVGTSAGHTAVDSFETGFNPFSFKCHRVDGLAFPVNCIAHNRKYGSFATGGGDGHISFWDGTARKRIAQFARYPTSIASIDFDPSSERIAVAVSYTFEEGEKDHPPDEVHIRRLEDSHIATKSVKLSDDSTTHANGQ